MVQLDNAFKWARQSEIFGEEIHAISAELWESVVKHYDSPWKGITVTVFSLISTWAELAIEPKVGDPAVGDAGC